MGHGPSAARRRRDRALDRGRRRAARISARRGGAAARPADQQLRQPVRRHRDARGVDGDHRDRGRHAVADPTRLARSRRTPEGAGGRQAAADVAHGAHRRCRGDRVAASGRAVAADERAAGYRRATARRGHPAIGVPCAARRATRGAGAVVERVLAAGRLDGAADDAGVRRRGDRRPQAATSRSTGHRNR